MIKRSFTLALILLLLFLLGGMLHATNNYCKQSCQWPS